MKALVSASELRTLLQSGEDILVLDCRMDLMNPEKARERYDAEHIPGAHFLSLETDLSGPKTPGSSRHPLPSREALTALYSRLGITPRTKVISCDDTDHAGAARAWWLLKWMGHDEAQVLDGGLNAWKSAGGKVDSGAPQTRPATSYVPRDGGHLTARYDEKVPLLVDSRAPERFRGDVEPIDPVAGHIPGARNFFYKQLLAADGRFKPMDEVLSLFEAFASMDALKNSVFYCGSGVTACVNLLALEACGLGMPRLYPGSWSEYCQDPSRPVERG